MPLPSRSLAVVGADYPNEDGGNRRSEIAFCERGETLELRPEPKNKYDEHAIAVYSARGFQIGYISSQSAVYLGKLLREGHALHAVFQDVAPWGAIARVGIDHVPALPTGDRYPLEEDAIDHDAYGDDFYPDFLPPDE